MWSSICVFLCFYPNILCEADFVFFTLIFYVKLGIGLFFCVFICVFVFSQNTKVKNTIITSYGLFIDGSTNFPYDLSISWIFDYVILKIYFKKCFQNYNVIKEISTANFLFFKFNFYHYMLQVQARIYNKRSYVLRKNLEIDIIF